MRNMRHDCLRARRDGQVVMALPESGENQAASGQLRPMAGFPGNSAAYDCSVKESVAFTPPRDEVPTESLPP